jgi:hypothetical protein
MTHQEWIADRLALLDEVEAIENDLARVEQRDAVPDASDLRRRCADVRAGVVEQLRAGLDVALSNSHPGAYLPSEILH